MNLLALSDPIRRRWWLGYPLAVVLVCLALWIRMQFQALLIGFPFVTFFAGIIFTAFLAGAGPGLAATLLSALLADYYLIGPPESFDLGGISGWIGMAFFVGTSLSIVALMHGVMIAYRSQLASEQRLKLLNADLENRVAQRTRAFEAELSERAKAEAQVRQMQKLESVGQLTGGVAHDFNNMLGIVIGSLDLAIRRLDDPGGRVRAHIDNAMEGARRAAQLTSRLLAFSRQQTLSPTPIDPNRFVGGISDLLRRTLGEGVRTETMLADGLWPARADAGQLENSIINLAINARDAMEGRGKLTIATANTTLDEQFAGENAGAVPGDYVAICVIDTGAGMTPDIVARAFDPFFTTKAVGKGTGLGLSQVYGFVKQSGGYIKICSEVGHGTTVKLYLPRWIGNTVVVAPDRGAVAVAADCGERTILLVEDEAGLRATTCEALTELGYRVVIAEHAEAALALLDAVTRIDLLLTDVVMPGQDGAALAAAISAQRPGTAVLFMTGYAQNVIVHNGQLDAGVRLLQKPFTIAQLADKVRDAMARAD